MRMRILRASTRPSSVMPVAQQLKHRSPSRLSRWRPALDGWSSALRRPVDSGEKFTSLVTVGYIFPQQEWRLISQREARDARHLGFLLEPHGGGVRCREVFRGSGRKNGVDHLYPYCSALTIRVFLFKKTTERREEIDGYEPEQRINECMWM